MRRSAILILNDIDGWVREFPFAEAQVGLLAFLGNRPLGLDVIGSSDLYASLHERIVRGYIMDALAPRVATTAASESEAQLFLRRVSSARRLKSPTVGLWRVRDPLGRSDRRGAFRG